MSSCFLLAGRYALENKTPVPDASADEQVKSKWLLQQNWTCWLPGESAPRKPEECEDVSSAVPVQSRRPKFNYLQESGFMDYVNRRGLQCINKITGVTQGLDAETGNVKVADRDTSLPATHCVNECYNVNHESAECFECVASVLQNQPDLCPEAIPLATELARAVDCQYCAGFQGQSAPEGKDIEHIWQCITGTVHTSGLSREALMGIIVVAIMVGLTGIILAIYFGRYQPRWKKIMNQEQTLQRRGIDSSMI